MSLIVKASEQVRHGVLRRIADCAWRFVRRIVDVPIPSCSDATAYVVRDRLININYLANAMGYSPANGGSGC